MFCGEQTFADYNKLVELGTGTLRIDILAKECYFNNAMIEPLIIAMVLQEFLKRDCIDNNIDFSLLLGAQLVVKLQFSFIKEQDRKFSLNEGFNIHGEPVETDNWYRCDFACQSFIQTDEVIYKAEYERTREWPTGWPGI